jgi:hypothetical protein
MRIQFLWRDIVTIVAKTNGDIDSDREHDEQKLRDRYDAFPLPFSFRATLTDFAEDKEAAGHFPLSLNRALRYPRLKSIVALGGEGSSNIGLLFGGKKYNIEFERGTVSDFARFASQMSGLKNGSSDCSVSRTSPPRCRGGDRKT